MPEFEQMLVRSGIILVKYWFSITDAEQAHRFEMRIQDPLKQWKLSPMDVESRRRWESYTRAKEDMLARTHIPRRRGGWSTPSTSSAPASTASATCWSRCPTAPSSGRPSTCPSGVRNPDYVRGRSRPRCTCRRGY